MSSQPTRVLFVCLGNICRSPAAEGVFLDLLERENLSDAFEVDSAGTGHWHVGKRADPRMRAAAERRGIDLPSRARQIEPEDLSRFDWIITMDDSNLANVRALSAIQDPRGLAVLQRAVANDIGPSVRQAAAYGLGRLQSHD